MWYTFFDWYYFLIKFAYVKLSQWKKQQKNKNINSVECDARGV